MKTIGLVGFSFALRKNDEPNPCNQNLASEVKRIARQYTSLGYTVYIVVQWEIALALDQAGFGYHLKVDPAPDKYLDSEDVMAVAAKYFDDRGVSKVIPVANPFLHMIKCKKLVEQYGFTVEDGRVGVIGFDPKSDQWWTRGPIQLILYAIRQKFFGSRG